MARRTILAACATLVLGAALRADVIHLKDGRELEGKVLREEGSNYVVRLRGGTMKIPKRDVARIEPRKLPEEIYKEKLNALQPGDVPGLLALATWCKEQGLGKEYREALTRVARLDPRNEEANLGLGNVLVSGEWVSPAEAKAAREREEAAEREAQGLVLHKGKWIPREHKENLEKGLILHEGKWLSPEELKIAQGLVKIGDRWVPKSEKARMEAVEEMKEKLHRDAFCAITEHFKLVHLRDQETSDRLAAQAEAVYKHFNELFGHRETKRHWTSTADYYVVDSEVVFRDFCDTITPRYIKDKGTIDWFKSSPSKAFHNSRPPISCHVLRPKEDEEGHVTHVVSHFLLDWHTLQQNPPWLREGFSSYMEVRFREASRVHCITRMTYGGSSKVAEKAKEFSAWKELIRDSVLDRRDTPLLQMKDFDLNRLDFEHLSKSWSLVTFMITEHKDKFVKWIDGIKKGETPDRAMYLAFSWKAEEMDDAWRKWVKANY